MKNLLCVSSVAIATLLFSSCSEEFMGSEEIRTDQNGITQDLIEDWPAQNSINSEKQHRKILFISKRDGNDEIYAMNADGLNVCRLTYNSNPDGRATWSANGQHIAFASGATGARDIFVMNANGSGLRNITNTIDADEDWPDWSPQGNRIIFSSNRDGNHEIYVTDLDSENATRLTYRTQDDKWPAWCPSGFKIAFQSNLGAPDGTDVFVMDADGSNVTRLTNAQAADQMPTWSPDMKIAFMSTRNGYPQVFVMNQDGSGQAAINSLTGARPSWSTDGEWIVFTGGSSFPSSPSGFELYKMKADGTDVTSLTFNSTYDDYPFIK